MMFLRLIRRFIFAVVILAILWLAGLVVYVHDVATMPEPEAPGIAAPTDAIVALTGGSARIATGISLLQKNLGKKLFISGVGAGIDLAHMRDGEALSLERRACCVVLGHEADDTMGNAAETLAWLKAEHYRSFRLVTAHYHMARSLVEFRILDPQIVIVPHPVAPSSVRLGDWWARPGTARLLIIEYNKLLLTLARYALAMLP